MNRFRGFLLKEFFHIVRDKRTLIILLFIPIIQILLFGYVLSNEIKNSKIAILDFSKDNHTRKLTDRLTSSGYFLVDCNLNSIEEIEELFKNGNIKMVIVFENRFGDKLERENKASLQLICDASDPNTASILSSYAQSIINGYINSNQIQPAGLMQIKTETRMLYNPELKGAYMFIPGTIAMLLMLISAMMTSISITKEKESGTMEVLLVSPLKPVHIIIGKVMPYVVLSFLISLIIILLGNTVFQVPVQGNVCILLGECLLFICMALSLGIFISTIAKTQQTAMMISMVALMLPTILLSGFIFPVENMPNILQWISAVMPPKYFIIIVKNIMLKGTGIEYVWKETLILAGMTVFFLTLSAKKFNIRLSPK